MKKRLAMVMAAVLVLALLLTSCKPPAQNQGPQKEVAKSEAATDPSKLPQSAKDRKDTLIVGTTAPSGKFNPIYSDSVYDSWVAGLIHDSLISNDAEGKPIPLVAKSWKISEDGKTITFTLNKGVKFSNGDELKASDVEFTYLAIADPSYDGPRMDAVQSLAGYEEYNKDTTGAVKNITGIKVINDYEISFTTKEVKATAIWDYGYGIMSKKYYGFEKGNIKSLKDKFLTPMGAGPYKLKSYAAGQEVDFEKNKNYWQGEPKIGNIIMKVTNSSTVVQELTTGGTDIDRVATKKQNVDLLKQAGFLNVVSYPANSYGYIGWNMRLPMFADKNVRQALVYGFDRTGFINAYYAGYGTVSNAPVSPVSWAYTEDVNKYPYDKAKAEQLLDAAGWKMGNDGFRYKDGKKFTIHFSTYTGSAYVDALVPILTKNWKDIGVELVTELMEFATLSEKVYDKQEFEMYNMAWSLSIDPDPSGIFSKAQAEKGGFNSVGWINDQSEKLMADGLKEVDQTKRAAIYKQWVKLASDELPYIFLSQSNDIYGVSARVKNVKLSPFENWTYDIHKVELVDPTTAKK